MNCELINKSPYSQPSQIILPKANNWISQLKPHDISQSSCSYGAEARFKKVLDYFILYFCLPETFLS